MKTTSLSLQRARGFTLIELMLVVAIIGLLGTIAIPQFRMFSIRAKRAERDVMLEKIKQSVDDLGDRNFTAAANPPPSLSAPGPSKRRFSKTVAGWNLLSWQPDGDLYFSYEVISTQSPPALFLIATSDLDGDGVLCTYTQTFTHEPGTSWHFTGDSYSPAAGCM